MIGLLFRPLECLLSLKPVPQSTPLVIIRMDQLGDFLLNRGLIDACLPQNPVLILNSKVEGLARICYPNLIIIGVDLTAFRSTITYRAQLLNRVRGLGATTVIHPVYSRHHFVVDAEAMVIASGATRRIGFAGEPRWRSRLTGIFYTQLVTTRGHHETQKYQDLCAALGYPSPQWTRLSPPPHSRQISGDFVVIFPSPTSPKREWPAQSFIKVLNFITESKLGIPVICGDKRTPVVTDILNADIPNLINMVGKTTLSELVALVSDATWCLGIEGGGVHIAGALNVETVVISGGGHWGRFVPYPVGIAPVRTVAHLMACFGCSWECIYPKAPYVPCLREITVSQVIDEIKQLEVFNGH